MTNRPEDESRVGERAADGPQPTEMFDYFAREGLLKVLLATSRLRRIAAEHPVEYSDLPALAEQLGRVAAYLEMGLKEAGYHDSQISRIPRSQYKTPPHDPKIPRTNI